MACGCSRDDEKGGDVATVERCEGFDVGGAVGFEVVFVLRWCC